MALKPMNCPAHVLIFSQGIKSYRDLPIRMAEFGCCHRNEPHGALHGIMRVRQFTQDDAHIFVREDQLVDEVRAFCDLLDSVYRDLGFDRLCDQAGAAPRQALRRGRDVGQGRAELRDAVAATGPRHDRGYGWEELPGEGAFYAPKLEFHLTDAIGRTWQVGTIQSDTRAARAARRELCRRGRRAPPPGDAPPRDPRHVRTLHRHPDRASCRPLPAVAGAGAGGGRDDRVRRRRLCAARSPPQLRAAGLRVETDLRNEKINYKVREHSLAKVPNLLVVGKREAEEGNGRAAPARQPGAGDADARRGGRALADEARAPDMLMQRGRLADRRAVCAMTPAPNRPRSDNYRSKPHTSSHDAPADAGARR